MKFDVIVIGSGQAGVPLASRLAAAKKSVLLAERGELGGTCVNVGCTPTKTLVASARAAHVARTAGRLGIQAGPVRVDFGAVVARKDSLVKRWRAGVENRLARAGESLRVVRGHARFVGPRRVEVCGEEHSADTVIVNVGARPSVPSIPGLASAKPLSSSTLLDVRELPTRLVVLGGGNVGCEFAQIFRRLGAEVVVVDQNPHLLSREDPDVSEALEGVFRAEGIVLELGSGIMAVEGSPGHPVVRLVGGKTVDGSHLLVAAGRTPNTADLGCDAAGVALDLHGFIGVGDAFETNVPGVYAVGDCNGGPQYTHTAWDDHRLLYDQLMGHSARLRSGRVVPFAVFTDPQVAGVGLNEREARAGGVRFDVATMAFGDVARAIEVDETAGIMKVLVDPESERVLGARIVGAEAGELIHVFAVLMQSGAGVRGLVDMEVAHPTFAEGLQSLAMKLPRFALR